jgi:PST family polysaccharide transporter
VILVSRFLINQLGIGSSGIFSNAWRIASVYLGAVTSTAISYYLPTMTRAESAAEMRHDLNAAIRFYLYVLPPIMAIIMAAGEPIVWTILSRNFLAVAPLLLLFVPAELMRVLAETINVPLYSRRCLKAFLAPYCLHAVVFVAGAYMALPSFGMLGAAAAYGAGTTAAAIANLVACRIYLGIGPDRYSVIAFARAAMLLVSIMIIGFAAPFGVERLALAAIAILLWAFLSVWDPPLRKFPFGKFSSRGLRTP